MVDRETLIEASIAAFAATALTTRGYDPARWQLLEAWPSNMTELDRVLIALGFNFDDGGQQGECGSDLKHRLYTIEFWVFGRSNTEARNYANVLKFAIEGGDYGTIPLLDVERDPPAEIDRLIVLRAETAHQAFQEPEPWQQFVWSTTFTIEDWYYPSLAGSSSAAGPVMGSEFVTVLDSA